MKTECNCAKVIKSLNNVEEALNDIIAALSCPKRRAAKGEIDAACKNFDVKRDKLIATIRDSYGKLSYNCSTVLSQIKSKACGCGENVITATLASIVSIETCCTVILVIFHVIITLHSLRLHRSQFLIL